MADINLSYEEMLSQAQPIEVDTPDLSYEEMLQNAQPIDNPPEYNLLDNDVLYSVPSSTNAKEAGFLVDLVKRKPNTFMNIGTFIADPSVSGLVKAIFSGSMEGTQISQIPKGFTDIAQGGVGLTQSFVAGREESDPLSKVSPAAILSNAVIGDNKSKFENVLKKAQNNLSRFQEEWGLNYKGDSSYDQFSADLLSGTPSLAVSVGLASIASPAASAVFFGGIQKGQLFQESEGKGMSLAERQNISTLGGVVEGALEAVGMNFLLKAFKGTTPVRRFIQGALSEGLQEASQSGGESAVTGLGGLRDVTVQGAVEDALYSGLLGAILGGGSSLGFGSSGDAKIDAFVQDYIEKNKDNLPSVDEIVGEALDDFNNPWGDVTADLEASTSIFSKFINGNEIEIAPEFQELADFISESISPIQQASIDEVSPKDFSDAITTQMSEDPLFDHKGKKPWDREFVTQEIDGEQVEVPARDVVFEIRKDIKNSKLLWDCVNGS